MTGEAKKRGTFEQRKAAAVPKTPYSVVDLRDNLRVLVRDALAKFTGLDQRGVEEKVLLDYIEHVDKNMPEPRRSMLLRMLRQHHADNNIHIVKEWPHIMEQGC